ncbi:hypothetical protein H7X46_01865 [Pseudonocardia sp. C8]|uniref:hypothetical protein n=1 Tax=Pseudonocardia sp. C8 TaxID=2762759 RepID=UPI00164275C4|nr:hypothetical protein [Pseudonocardia sp. C8]MBC3189812.1 hypothetical protein [Pseudonocardia sp. C8]
MRAGERAGPRGDRPPDRHRWAAVRAALAAFEEIEQELAGRLGASRIASLRSVLSDLLGGAEPDRPDR